jgi:hypothetical protein
MSKYATAKVKFSFPIISNIWCEYDDLIPGDIIIHNDEHNKSQFWKIEKINHFSVNASGLTIGFLNNYVNFYENNENLNISFDIFFCKFNRDYYIRHDRPICIEQLDESITVHNTCTYKKGRRTTII